MSLIRTFVIGFRICSDNPRLYSQLEILNLITSVKTRFPNKVIIAGFRDKDMGVIFWWGDFFAYCVVEGAECSNFS